MGKFENFSVISVTHDPPNSEFEIVRKSDEAFDAWLSLQAETFLNPPPEPNRKWTICSLSDTQHKFTAHVYGADYRIVQERDEVFGGWVVEVAFSPTDTGKLTLIYEGLDKIAKVAWTKTGEGCFVISDFEGNQAQIDGDAVTEILPSDDDGVITMAEIRQRLAQKGQRR